MVAIILAALAIGIFSSTREGRREAREKLARWNWVFGGFTVVAWSLIIFA